MTTNQTTTNQAVKNGLRAAASSTDVAASVKGFGSVRVRLADGANLGRFVYLALYRPPASAVHQPPGSRGKTIPDDWLRVREVEADLLDGGYVFAGVETGGCAVECPYDGLEEEVLFTEVKADCFSDLCFRTEFTGLVTISNFDDDCVAKPCAPLRVNEVAELVVSAQYPKDYIWPPKTRLETPQGMQPYGLLKSRFVPKQAGVFRGTANVVLEPTRENVPPGTIGYAYEATIEPEKSVPVAGSLTVSHRRRIAEPTGPMAFFVHLLDASNSVGFNAYREFIDRVLCRREVDGIGAECEAGFTGVRHKLGRLQTELTDHGVGAYELLRTATEAFLLLRCCIRPCDAQSRPAPGAWPGGPYPDNPQLGDYRRIASEQWQGLYCDYRGTLARFLGNNRLPYIDRVVQTAFPEYQEPAPGQDPRFCDEVLLRSRVDNPCFMELIWNYWLEEGMLVQAINAVSRRFQNLRAPGQRDPLAHMEIDPLRPLNNILWGYVENERDRLSIRRRAYEYQHQYGLGLYGKAVADLRPADTRSKFIEAFHNLLNKCADYYRAKQDTTVDPDGYPILHAIQELNLILAQGAHNQFGDLAWNARVDALMQQWILARPELRDFLQSRAMVPYKEAWMPQVDTMKTLQGWSDVVVTHFRDLGVFGEQILLTIRWYNWYDVTSEEEAKDWADLLRAQIQSYIHAYRAVTGVDLSNLDTVDYTIPSVHLRKRLALQQRAR